MEINIFKDSIDNVVREVIITKKEYENSGISKKEFINRLTDSKKQY